MRGRHSFSCFTIAVFVPLLVLTIWAGFFNHAHFIGAAFSLLMILFALFDTSNGESLYERLKDFLCNHKDL